jgi:hypothetical protein
LAASLTAAVMPASRHIGGRAASAWSQAAKNSAAAVNIRIPTGALKSSLERFIDWFMGLPMYQSVNCPDT